MRPSQSVIGDPHPFDGTNPDEYTLWKIALNENIRGDGPVFFNNLTTTWEYMCGRTRGKVALHMRQFRWEEFVQSQDIVMGGTEHYRQEQIIKGFVNTFYKNFGNPVLDVTINDMYQTCTQGNRTFQAYYQELSYLSKQLGFSTTDNRFKGILEYRTSGYLKFLAVNKTYATVAEAVKDLQMVDAKYQLLNKPGGKKAKLGDNPSNAENPTRAQLEKELAALKRSQQHKETEAAKVFQKKQTRKVRAPGSIDEPCADAGNCKWGPDKCWRKH
jgi:hypothetical protein